MKLKIKTVLIALVVTAVGALVVGEVGVRMFGLVDFPLYLADKQIGYILAPNQSGAFLDKNHWLFNDKSQGTGPWQPNGKRDLLLLGDSVVLGGNLLDQPQKLGPELEKRLDGWRVWPASAGSWSAANEIAYLDRFPEVPAESDIIVWVLNTGDLDRASEWKKEETHPRSHPVSALVYLFNKYIRLPYFPRSGDAPPPPDLIQASTENNLRARYQVLQAQMPGRRILFVVYPSKGEVRPAEPSAEKFYQTFVSHLRADLGDRAEIYEVRDDKRWSTSLYRDGIHPSAAGNAVLADFLAERLKGPAVSAPPSAP